MHAGASPPTDLEPEVWIYSCPTTSAEAVLSGIARTAPVLTSLAHVHDLYTALNALLAGAAASQRALVSHFGIDYRHCVEVCGPGWAAREPARAACSTLLRRCLALLPVDSPDGALIHPDWRGTVLHLASLTVDRYAACNLPKFGFQVSMILSIFRAMLQSSCLLPRLMARLFTLTGARLCYTSRRPRLDALRHYGPKADEPMNRLRYSGNL